MSVFDQTFENEVDKNQSLVEIRPNWPGSMDISLKLIVASHKVSQSFSLIDTAVTNLNNERKRVKLSTLTHYNKIAGINNCLKAMTSLTAEFIKTLSKFGYMYGNDAAWFQKITNYFRKEAINMYEFSYRLREALINGDCCLLEENINSIVNSLKLIMEIKEKVISEFSKIKHQQRGITKEDVVFWQQMDMTASRVAELRNNLPPAYTISLRDLVKRAQVDEYITLMENAQ